MWDGSAVFCCRTLSVCLCIWSILLGSAVLFPSDSDHSVNTISARGAAMFVCVCPSLSSACVRWVCIWSTCFSVSYLTLCTDTLPYCTLSLGTDSIAFYSVVEFGFANEWCNSVWFVQWSDWFWCCDSEHHRWSIRTEALDQPREGLAFFAHLLVLQGFIMYDWGSLSFRCFQNWIALFCIFMIRGYLPNSALHVLFVVCRCTCSIFLQSSACRVSIGCFSHLVRSWFSLSQGSVSFVHWFISAVSSGVCGLLFPYWECCIMTHL